MQESNTKTYIKHGLLFVITFVTTTLAGAEWIYGRSFLFGEELMGWKEFIGGMEYSIPFLLILTVHEFGHYIVARRNNVKVSLPFYLPMWVGFIGGMSIGTFGAFIKIKSFIVSKKLHFDIGLAGPLAGFIVAIGVLWYGFATLPEPEYIFDIHPNYEQYGLDYADHVYDNDSIINMSMGTNLTFMFFEKFVVDDPAKIPNAHEMMHYPWLMAGFLALLFTALNLLPIGQLDGGHILYGLIGSKLHKPIAELIFIGFIVFAGTGLFSPYQPADELVWIPFYIGFLFLTLKGLKRTNLDTFMYALAIFTFQFLVAWIKPQWIGYEGWLVFAFLIGRFLGVHHPPALDESPLDINRQILGWIALFIFIISFSPTPIII